MIPLAEAVGNYKVSTLNQWNIETHNNINY